MTAKSNEVVLLVNGQEYGGWKSISFTAGIERVARDFTLAVTDKWPGQNVAHRIKPFDSCEVYIDQDKVLTGLVDATPISYDASGVAVGVQGRSKTGEIVDCSAINSPGQWKGQKIERITADLVKAYGIDVICNVDTGDVIADHQIQQGETIFESIDRLLSLRNLLVTDDEFGRIVFLKPGAFKATSRLMLGENILTASAGFDFKQRFSEYRTKGRRSGTVKDSDAKALSQQASALDPNILRKRVLLVIQSGQCDASNLKLLAEYERAHRMAKSLATTYSVQGWRQADGSLWKPNMTVQVVDPVLGHDRELLISELEMRRDESGTVTTMQVAPKEGFLHKPHNAKKKKTGTGKGGDGWAGLFSKSAPGASNTAPEDDEDSDTSENDE